MEKSNFKKLLATASAFAVITGSATGASAVTNFTTNAAGGANAPVAVTLDATTAANTTGTNNDGTVLAASDTFEFNEDYNTVTSQNGAIAGNGVGVAVTNQGAAWVANDSIYFAAITAGNTMTLSVADEKTVTLTNATVTGLGNITLNGANGSTLAITKGMTLTGSILSGGDKGVVTVKVGENAIFDGAVGTTANAIAEMQVGGTARFNQNSVITKLTMSEVASRTTIANGKTLTISAADLHASSDISGAAANGDGVLAITEGNAFTIDATVGGNNRLDKITVAAKADVNFTNTVAIENDAEIAGTVTFTKGVANAGIASTANTADISVGTAAAAADVTGALDLANGGKATVTGHVTGAVTAGAANGNANVAATIDINKDNNGANGGNAGDVTAGTGSTVNVAGNAAAVTANGAGATVTVGGNTTGNVVLNNEAAVTVTGDIGGTTTLTNAKDVLTLGKGTSTGAVINADKIKVTGDRVFANANGAGANAAGNLGAVEVQSADVGLTFSTDDHGLSGGVLTTLAEDKSNNITISTDQTLDATTKIGTSDNQFGNIIFDGDKTLTLNTKEVYAAITTKTDAEGKVVFNNANGTTSVRALGTSTKKLHTVTFTENATVAEGTYSENMVIAASKTATLGGVVKVTNDVNIGTAADSRFVFQDGAEVDMKIRNTGGADRGIVTFEGAGSFVQDIGAAGAATQVAEVNFNGAGKTVEVGADVFATGIAIAEGAIVQLTADRQFEVGANGTALNGGTIDAQGFALDHQGNMTVNGQNNVFKVDVTANAATGALEGGQILITGNLDYTAADDLITIYLNDSTVALKQGEDRSRVVATVTNTNLTVNNIELVAGRGFAGYKDVAIVNGTDVTATRFDNTEAALKAIRSGSAKTAAALANAAAGTKAASLKDLLDTFATADNNAKVNETLDRIEKGSIVRSAVFDSMQSVAGNLDARMTETASIQTASGATVTGVAAGDDAARFGAWASPFYGHVNQSARNGFSGYKNEAYGLTAGLDTKVNEDLVLGVSVSAAHSNIKHKDTKSGDRTKVDTLLFSLYHTQAISDNWFLSGTMTFASNDINNTAKRNTATGYETATAKYSVTSFDLKEMVGYNYAMGDATITPMIGAKYTRVNNASYTESATTYGLDIATKAFDKVDVIAGGRITGNAYDVSGISLTPEAHAFIQYDLLNRTQKQTVSLGGSELDSSVNKAARMQYNLGLGVSSKYGAMEYGAGYDLQLASKRVGHQGSLKVRVNF